MKYVLTASIHAKCELFTSKINFVVTNALRYALRATYFITQRAEAHLAGATQRKECLSLALSHREEVNFLCFRFGFGFGLL